MKLNRVCEIRWRSRQYILTHTLPDIAHMMKQVWQILLYFDLIHNSRGNVNKDHISYFSMFENRSRHLSLPIFQKCQGNHAKALGESIPTTYQLCISGFSIMATTVRESWSWNLVLGNITFQAWQPRIVRLRIGSQLIRRRDGIPAGVQVANPCPALSGLNVNDNAVLPRLSPNRDLTSYSWSPYKRNHVPEDQT
jgi:hypothetical protein